MFCKSAIAATMLGLCFLLTATDASAHGGRKGPAADKDDKAQVESERGGRRGADEQAGHGRRHGGEDGRKGRGHKHHGNRG